jgi:hypothetical protein
MAIEEYTPFTPTEQRYRNYTTWNGMIHRCYDPDSPSFKYYGARGITICDRWRNSVHDFIADMGNRPSMQHSLDRIDNTVGYEPGNCRWATTIQQCNNRSSNVYLQFDGRRQTIANWARELGITTATLWKRLKRRTLEEALTMAPGERIARIKRRKGNTGPIRPRKS